MVALLAGMPEVWLIGFGLIVAIALAAKLIGLAAAFVRRRWWLL